MFDLLGTFPSQACPLDSFAKVRIKSLNLYMFSLVEKYILIKTTEIAPLALNNFFLVKSKNSKVSLFIYI